MHLSARRRDHNALNLWSISDPVAVIVSLYVIEIVAAEAVGVLVGVVPSIVCHAIIIVALLNHYLFSTRERQENTSRSITVSRLSRILPALALLPLLRILSVTMPIRGIPHLYWYALVGTPVLIAAFQASRLLHLSRREIGLYLQSPLTQGLIAATGFPLGLIGFLLFRPVPLVENLSWPGFVLSSFILMVFTGLTEEFVFRGLVQRAMNDAYGQKGWLWSSVIFTGMYSASLSPGFLLFIGLVGLYFGWCVRRTGSLWGVILAHGYMSIGMLLVFPTVLR